MLSLLLLTGILNIVLPSCSGDEPTPPAQKERLILIYAVAANNLQPNLGKDMEEILDVAPSLDLESNAVLVYSVDNSGECLLQQLAKDKTGRCFFETVRQFPQLPLSTSEERISEVMEYVSSNYTYPNKGLVLWSHADGWLPWFAGSTPEYEKRRSFGWDNFEGNTYKTNITSLAEAIPDNMFDFIWFDCCYMANIETIFQLREKTPTIVGSVLEIASDGMPYQLTMPYLLRRTPDFREAAFQFFSYYDRSYTPVSVSIIDTSGLDFLALAAGDVMKTGTPPANLSTIQTYQRSLPVKFYDMGQLLRSYSGVPTEVLTNLDEALDATVVYKLISDLDFSNRPVNTRDYSGLSMHHFTDSGSPNEEFYKTLDWYKATDQ